MIPYFRVTVGTWTKILDTLMKCLYNNFHVRRSSASLIIELITESEL
jgi:hypothetical protein